MNFRIYIIILFCLITSGISAQENPKVNTIVNQLEVLQIDAPGLTEALNINITETSLSNFLIAVSKIHKLNLNVSPELNNISIINNFSDVSVKDLLIFLLKEYNLDIDFTGNILSIGKYVKPPATEEQINLSYNPANDLFNLDVNNEKLDKVFRAIMDASGANLLFSPDIQNKALSLYITNTPFDVALNKLAETNDLLLTKSKDGFYVFDDLYPNNEVAGGQNQASRPKRVRRGNFYYKVLDTVVKTVSVDFQNTPVADVVYTISEDLKLDIFTATPLDNAGFASVKAESINFDTLLSKIFQSAISSDASGNDNRSTNNNSNRANTQPASNFTFKKEGSVYYFGTENQLSLKQTELVQFINRSVNKFNDPKRSTQDIRNENFITGGVGDLNSGNGFNQNFNNNPNTVSRNNDTNVSLQSIIDLIPENIKDGLDIRADFELNGFVVSGSGVKVELFKKFIKEIDKAVPVILIEVMIMEVNRSAIVETGISFGLGDAPVQTQGSVFPSTDIQLGAQTANRIIGRFNGFGSLNIGNVLPEFYLDIKAMESNGDVKILSTPQLSALNGHKAYLSSSNTTYYAITNQSFIGTQIPQTTQIRNFVPISAELALEIRPFVSGDGHITMDIQVIQSSFSGSRIEEDAPPDINTREFSSIIRMKDQDVAILGGIEQKIKDDTGSGVPLLSRIPVIKWLFSKRRREDSKRTLNVLIKPTVIR